ncbi:MAG: bifunctional 4-hydroxy-2-oxoglutarate aldolase/2-dehydro-3-deoxy-phosphogluconate aldolase [Turicibacter sp.]|nr:bifunctional 4-hydroxy-2-oxoglutarate aldolase/2-dehydro-3-deoxy-phosphogluconate aldolase [Turicibacter sp.]
MDKMTEQIRNLGIVPVVKLDSAKDAIPLAKALIDGGLPCAEITFRTDAAAESIKLVTDEYPEMLVGAGTVTTLAQLESAIKAGATFIVSPGFNPTIVKACIDAQIPVFPGCVTPSEIEGAMEFGLKTLKFFPAEQMGGLNVIQALCAPYVNITFMPTGGVNTSNIVEYLNFPKVIACGGSWMVDPKLIAAGDFESITRITREAIATVIGFELAHVGIECGTDEKVNSVVNLFCSVFGLERKPTTTKVFAGSMIECGTELPLNKNHIAISTNFIDRAVHQLESRGIEFLEGSEVRKDGVLQAIYLKDDFGGLAVHLLQKK